MGNAIRIAGAILILLTGFSCTNHEREPSADEIAGFVTFEDLKNVGFKLSRQDKISKNMVSYKTPDGGQIFTATYTLTGPEGGSWILITACQIRSDEEEAKKAFQQLTEAFRNSPQGKQGFDIVESTSTFSWGEETSFMHLKLAQETKGMFFLSRKGEKLYQLVTEGFEIPEEKLAELLQPKLDSFEKLEAK